MCSLDSLKPHPTSPHLRPCNPPASRPSLSARLLQHLLIYRLRQVESEESEQAEAGRDGYDDGLNQLTGCRQKDLLKWYYDYLSSRWASWEPCGQLWCRSGCVLVRLQVLRSVGWKPRG